MDMFSYIIFQPSVEFFPLSWWAGLYDTRSIQSCSYPFLLHNISSQTPAPHTQDEARYLCALHKMPA